MAAWLPLWYINLAKERGVFDEMHNMPDQNATTSFREIVNRVRCDQGLGFFCYPGVGYLFDRLPRLRAVLGN